MMRRVLRRVLRGFADRSVRESHRCAGEALRLEYIGGHRSTACHLAWLGAEIYETRARVLGYQGPSLEEQLGRPARPIDPAP